MIDLIKTHRRLLTDSETEIVVGANYLKPNTAAGVPYYDNKPEKNLEQHGGVHIRIDTGRKLSVEFSVHKYYNKKVRGTPGNLDLFNMDEAIRTMEMVIKDKQIPSGLMVNYYEVGLNLYVEKDCRAYLDKIYQIGVPGGERKMYVNPKYPDERAKASCFANGVRKYFKVYDKVYEMMDKRSPVVPEDNILRIETVRQRVEKMPVDVFFSRSNLLKEMERFFRDWRTLAFERDIQTPKGTGRTRQALIRSVLQKGKEKVLSEERERWKGGFLTDWEFRNIREFLQNEYDELKQYIRLVPSPEEIEFKSLLSTLYPLMKMG